MKVGNSSEIPAGHQDGSLELGLYARNYALVPDALVTLADDFGPDGADYGAMGWNNTTLTSTLNTMAADRRRRRPHRTAAARSPTSCRANCPSFRWPGTAKAPW